MIVEGWASTSDRDHSGHTVLPSAYANSIKRYGLRGPQGIKLLHQHKPDRILGHIRKLEVRNRGLWIEAEVNEDLSYGRDAAIATKARVEFQRRFLPG